MSHVFISYAHVDGDFAATLIRELSDAGINAWVDSDQLRAGQDWRTGIDQAIEDAFALIVIVTPEAKTSEYVTYEWAFGLGTKTPVIPVMLKMTPLHPRLETLQYLDFTDHQSRPWQRLIDHLQDLGGDNSGSVVIPKGAPPVVKQALAALDNHDPAERRKAIDSLAQMKHPTAIEALAASVQHPALDVRIDAAFRLAQLTHYKDDRALPGLLDALQSDDAKTCSRAAEILGKMRNVETVPVLFERLFSEEGRIRRAVAGALVKMGTPAVPGLLDALYHRDQRIREVAAWSLGEIKDPEAVTDLVEQLTDRDAGVLRAITEALVKIGREAPTPAVNALLDTLGHEQWNVRLLASRTLGEIGDERAVAGLVNVLSDEYGDVRKIAAEALGKLEAPTAVPALENALSDTFWGVPETAVHALERIGTPEALAAVEQWRAQQKDGQENEAP